MSRRRKDDYKIISSVWRTGLHTIGFVAYKTPTSENPDLWCATVGLADSLSMSEDDDEQEIAAWGAKLTKTEAHAFFPRLDINNYKYQ